MEIRRRVVRLVVYMAATVLTGAAAQLVDPLTQPGWQHFYNNEFDAAVADFQRDTVARPDDPDGWDHLAQAILYREMYRNGALESQLVSGTNPFLRRAKFDVTPQVRTQFRAAIDKAITLAQAALARNANDTHALYALSVAHGLRANYLFLVEKAWIDALHDASASSKYSNRLVEIDPGFIDSYIIQGVQNYVVGSLPLHWKVLGFLSGFHGDRELGIRQLQLVAEHGVLSKYDARILLAAIYRRERRSQDAISLLKGLAELFPRNYLFRLDKCRCTATWATRARRSRHWPRSNGSGGQGSPDTNNCRSKNSTTYAAICCSGTTIWMVRSPTSARPLNMRISSTWGRLNWPGSGSAKRWIS